MIYNLPNTVKELTERVKVKATSENYTNILTLINNLPTPIWFNTISYLKQLVVILEEYQKLAIDGDLQDALDLLEEMYWFNIVGKVQSIKNVVLIIESL